MRRHPRSRGAAGTHAATASGGGADGVAHTIRSRGRSAGVEDTFAIEVIPIQEAQRSSGARNRKQHGMGIGKAGDPMFTITTRADHGVFAFDEAQITHPENRATVAAGDPVPSISKSSRLRVAGGMRPRRLTPLEVERCFGFPDNYTLIPGAKDSNRYEALGNSCCIPPLTWIGQRLITVETIIRGAA